MTDEKIARRQLNPNRPAPDLSHLKDLSDEQIAQAVANDPDAAPLIDDAWMANAALVENPKKIPITARFDAEVIDFFKAQGEGYQTRMNAVLLSYVRAQKAKSGQGG